MDGNKPFKNLKSLLKNVTPREEESCSKEPLSSNEVVSDKISDPMEPETNFKKTMADVTPIVHNKIAISTPKPFKVRTPIGTSFEESVQPFHKMILDDEGYVISDIPEYMEGTGYNVHPEMTKRLHKGEFSIQDHIDLHGMNRDKAKEAIDDFLHSAIKSGKRAVLIIHGRGLSSPIKPVLKGKVREWLTTGLWRKWILAFSSARAVDGGAGATYVLLRKNPATKSQRKGHKFRHHHEY